MKETSSSESNLSAVIPINELERLADAMDHALALRSRGHLAYGYQVLLDGHHRAEHLRRVEVSWGDELVYRWQQACEAYTDHFRIPLPA